VIDGGRNEQISQQLYVLYVRHRREREVCLVFGEHISIRKRRKKYLT
jgi:hypothetical protein